ncbi:MAG: DUF2231 domain-containing protein [Janthinobacterium lividum]
MSDHPPARVTIAGQPLFGPLMAVPAVCFVGALMTDITYARSPDMQWTNFSAWLLAFAELFVVLALLVALIDLGHARVRRIEAARWRAVGLIVVAVLGLFNNFVHSRDAWTSVVPQGLVISIVTVLVLIPTLWLGRTLTYRHRVGVA